MTKPLEAANRPWLVVATPDDRLSLEGPTQAMLRADG
jgi:hypothetical protein